MKRVAQLAGVSCSTVSRVVNDRPNVAAGTAQLVRRAMQTLSVAPATRRSRGIATSARRGPRAASVAFLVVGSTGSDVAPSFDRLVEGVSDALNDHGLGLVFRFVSDPAELPPRRIDRRVDGLLLHGERPTGDLESCLRRLPTVWLMGNRRRPTWGDQVMPDNAAIGDLAARYLLRRGHRRLAYLGVDGASWSLGLRALSFARTAADAGAEVHTLHAPHDAVGVGGWHGDALAAAARSLADRFVRLDPQPTGLVRGRGPAPSGY